MNTPYRRILVIDTTHDSKSSFISKLSAGSIDNRLFEFQEEDIYDNHKNLYKFIIAPQLREEDFHKNGARAKLLLRDRLLNYEKDGLCLIIFYTNDTFVSLLTYNTYNFIVWNLTRIVPMITIVNKSENGKNVSIWKCQSELIRYIDGLCESVEILTDTCDQSNSIREIWKIIEKYSLYQTDDVNLINTKTDSQETAKPVSTYVKSKEQDKIKVQRSIDDAQPMSELKPNVYEKSMFNPSNTHIERLKQIIIAHHVADSSNNCVLITTGSFNPIHRSHLLNLHSVKQYLEKEHKKPWNVLMGYISPSHDKYIRSKLSETDMISSKDRCKLCEEAIKNEGETLSSWITVSDGECHYSPEFVNFDYVTEHLRDFLNNLLYKKENFLKHPLTIVYVCGLDHYNKCPEIDNLMKQRHIACAVIYRFNHDERNVPVLKQSSNAFYIPLMNNRNKFQDLSSTQIRNYYRNFKGDTNSIPVGVCPAVHQFMLRKYKKNYQ